MAETGQAGAAQALIDEMGIFFKGFGVPRAAGEMVGYLMACDPPEQSAGEIGAGIHVSPASVSSNMRLLIGLGAVEPKSRRGDRKTYYRMKQDGWVAMVQAELTAFGELAAMGRRIKAIGSLPRGDGLDDMIAFSDFWQEELPILMARWRERRQSVREER